MNTFIQTSIASVLALTLLTGCVNPGEDDPNASTKQGAAGGALLGLTLGALTGDAELAMKGAVAGGVAGGVAGATNDIQNNRENIRHDSRNDSLSQIGNGNNASTAPYQNKTQNWDQLNNFTGEWNVSIWSGASEQPVTASAKATGSLAKTTEARIQIQDLAINNNKQPLQLTANFAYTPDAGYTLSVNSNINNVPVQFAGEYQSGMNRYNYYPTSNDVSVIEGIDSSTVRLELAFAGQNVWMIDTYAQVNGKEEKIQTYRFTKS